MNKLDRAILEFVRRNDGKQPTVIYIGWNILVEVIQSSHQLDMRNRLYYGIPIYRVAGEDDHLAIY